MWTVDSPLDLAKGGRCDHPDGRDRPVRLRRTGDQGVHRRSAAQLLLCAHLRTTRIDSSGGHSRRQTSATSTSAAVGSSSNEGEVCVLAAGDFCLVPQGRRFHPGTQAQHLAQLQLLVHPTGRRRQPRSRAATANGRADPLGDRGRRPARPGRHRDTSSVRGVLAVGELRLAARRPYCGQDVVTAAACQFATRLDDVQRCIDLYASGAMYRTWHPFRAQAATRAVHHSGILARCRG